MASQKGRAHDDDGGVVRLTAWAEVDLDAIRSNLATIRRVIPADTKILLTVKADAYGLGAVPVARAAAEDNAVGMLGVATLDEGIELRRAGIDLPILVLSPVLADGASLVERFDLTATVCDLGFARALSEAADRRQRRAPVHVEVDTGMGRTGIACAEAVDFVAKLRELPGIEIKGLFTHFPVANEREDAFTRRQVDAFLAVRRELSAKGIEVPIAHAANSAAVLDAPYSHLGMVRPGLAVYGFPPYEPLPPEARIRPAMELKTRVLQVRALVPGDSVSYGRTHKIERPSRIAAIGIGYGHGYSRLLSNRGAVLIRGQRWPIVGRVTMDTTMVDVTGDESIAPGDEVVLFGRQEGAELRLEEVAVWQDTINYEVTCGIGRRVARVYRSGGREIWVKTMVGSGAPAKGRTANPAGGGLTFPSDSVRSDC